MSCASCTPLEDWSSYSAGGGASVARASPPRSVAGTDGSIPLASPPLADAAPQLDGAAAVDAGSSLREGGAALEPDGGSAASELTGVSSDGGAPAPSLPGALSGESVQTLRVAGVERAFIYHAPAGLDPNAPAPVLIVAHGFEETAADMVAITGFDSVADREGFVVLYPQGQGLIPWNIGDDVCQGGARLVASASGDDSAFVDAMLAFVASDRVVDAAHVFMTGLGSGAYLANDLACRRSDIRAVVSHSGGSHALDACVAAAKPALLLHGTEDTAVPVACGEQARERWVAHDG
ncbi:MAG TPA: PHB depolymerase family esterase, partial [Polyangiaceae bacterium]|nr:PHB depolymerase family esterase [Polyangiaceae bacterium]